jgi:hypothetical protein
LQRQVAKERLIALQWCLWLLCGGTHIFFPLLLFIYIINLIK